MIKKVHDIVTTPVVWLRKKFSDRQFFIFSSVFVGLTSGFAAVILKYFVHTLERVVDNYAITFEEFFLFALFPLLGLTLVGIIVRFFLMQPPKKGSAEIVYAITKKSSVIVPSEMYSHLLTSGLTVGLGGSVGLEAPMVNTGAAIGSNYSQTYNLSYRDRTILLACGAAGGIAAAFNAPIAGVLFAVEILLADVSATAFVPLIIAAASGALVSKIILREGVTLSFSLQAPFNYHNVPFYVLLGILAGLVSLFYSRSFAWMEGTMMMIKNRWLRTLTGGCLLFALLYLFPPLYGEGYETIKSLASLTPDVLVEKTVLHNIITSEVHIILFLTALVFLKSIAAAITIGSGGNGGSFGPSLFVGAYLGFVFARIVNLSGIATIPESNFCIVAMAGILSGVLYAPLTAIFLIAELTGGYELMIPLMIVSSLSVIIAKIFEPLSMEARKLAGKLNVSIQNKDEFILNKLELAELIETNFTVVRPEQSMSTFLQTISSSTRNVFPVVDQTDNFMGIIQMDDIRSLIFNPDLQKDQTVERMMSTPAAIIHANESLHTVLRKFEETHQWNLPVTDNGKYIGFVSKSSILSRYRNELVESA